MKMHKEDTNVRERKRVRRRYSEYIKNRAVRKNIQSRENTLTHGFQKIPNQDSSSDEITSAVKYENSTNEPSVIIINGYLLEGCNCSYNTSIFYIMNNKNNK